MDACNSGREQWFVEVEIIAGKSLMMLTQSPERVLVSVSFSGGTKSFSYQDAVGALAAKYGPATEGKDSIITNRMNASFEQQVSTWVDGDQKIQVSKHGGTIGTPTILYFGKQAIEDSARKSAEKAKKAAGNL